MGPVFVHLRDVQIPAPVPWGFFFLSKFLQFLDLLPIHSNTMVKRRPDLLESSRPRNSLVRLQRHVAGGGGDQLRFSPSIDMLEHSPMPQKTHLFFPFQPVLDPPLPAHAVLALSPFPFLPFAVFIR